MNYKNLLKEQLLSEIILPLRDFDPNLLSPTMKLKMGGRKGPDGNIISKLRNLKLQPSKGEQERIRPSGRPSYRPLRYGDRGPNPFGRLRYGDSGRPSYDPTDIENSLELRKRLEQEMRDAPPGSLLPKKNKREMSDLPRLTSTELEKYANPTRDSRGHHFGAQSLKPYKKKIGISLGFRKQNPDETIY